MASDPTSSTLAVTASSLGGSLEQLLMAEEIQPGADASYELCKVIYLYHPLGAKMAETPLKMAQSQAREIVVQDAPDEVAEAFEERWESLDVDGVIENVHALSRVYGIASLVLLVDGQKPGEPLDMTSLWDKDVSFNVLDPLNTAGSLVLSQIPTSSAFNKPVSVRSMGESFHPTRFVVVMNEKPVYLAYTGSAFGFVGRSVYQRALFPLKSFVRSMMADDMISTKLGLLVAKQKPGGSTVDKMMKGVAMVKAGLLKQAQTGQVLTVGTEEEIETLNMMNVDGAGTYSRTNIIKNVATAADMPAKLLDNETLVSGFGEGTEDAKNIAGYIEDVRKHMGATYRFFDKLVMHMAWTPEFYKRIQKLYPEEYGSRSYEDAMSEWRFNFKAEWPSLLREPESEMIKVEDVKLQALVAFLQTLLPEIDPDNKAAVIQWAADNLSEIKMLFPHDLEIDATTLEQWLEDHAEDNGGDEEQLGPEAKKFGRFDADRALVRLRKSVSNLPDRRRA